MDGKKFTHFTFPVTVLSGAFEDHKKVANNIMNYCGYALTLTYSGAWQARMKSAGHYMDIAWGNVNRCYQLGESLYNHTPAKTPMTSISKAIIWDYYTNEKAEFEIACFLAFAAIRSILQTKPYCKTNKALIHARMFGYRSTRELPDTLTGIEAKYALRWHMDKLIKQLEYDWHLKAFANHCRGIYVGFEKVDYKDLARECEGRKNRIKEQKLREKKQGALAAIRI